MCNLNWGVHSNPKRATHYFLCFAYVLVSCMFASNWIPTLLYSAMNQKGLSLVKHLSQASWLGSFWLRWANGWYWEKIGQQGERRFRVFLFSLYSRQWLWPSDSTSFPPLAPTHSDERFCLLGLGNTLSLLSPSLRGVAVSSYSWLVPG